MKRNAIQNGVSKSMASNGHASGVKNGILLNHVTEKTSKHSQWGRAWTVDWASFAGSLFILLICPILPAFFVISCSQNDCSVVETLTSIVAHPTPAPLLKLVSAVSMETFWFYVAWMMLQICLAIIPDFLHRLIPAYEGGIQQGAVTPAGNVHDYNINGLQAWLLTHILWLLNAFHFNFFTPSIISKNFVAFLIFANIFGYTMAGFSYIKGHLFPTNADDCKFSGSFIYDYLMGVEFNPRIGKLFDFKLFFNGRPGIVCWTIINLSFAWHQWEKYGTVTDSMVLLNILHAVYVLDFFWNETWYLKTIDICHDHFGFYLAWGDLVWLPFMYTLQGQYLVYHPVTLGTARFLLILMLGVLGYFIFRSTNSQKDRFRTDPDGETIWGKKASYINCMFTSADGRTHRSTLLTSGWWGITRHMNYTGDLLGSLSYCLCRGVSHIFPYFYIVYMLVLLIHRIYRDEHRCQSKYGKYWDEYTKVVPYRLIPGLY